MPERMTDSELARWALTGNRKIDPLVPSWMEHLLKWIERALEIKEQQVLADLGKKTEQIGLTQDDVADLQPGLYRLEWVSGGCGDAAVGVTSDGRHWFAPSAWTYANPFPTGDMPNYGWCHVKAILELNGHQVIPFIRLKEAFQAVADAVPPDHKWNPMDGA